MPESVSIAFLKLRQNRIEPNALSLGNSIVFPGPSRAERLPDRRGGFQKRLGGGEIVGVRAPPHVKPPFAQFLLSMRAELFSLRLPLPFSLIIGGSCAG